MQPSKQAQPKPTEAPKPKERIFGLVVRGSDTSQCTAVSLVIEGDRIVSREESFPDIVGVAQGKLDALIGEFVHGHGNVLPLDAPWHAYLKPTEFESLISARNKVRPDLNATHPIGSWLSDPKVAQVEADYRKRADANKAAGYKPKS